VAFRVYFASETSEVELKVDECKPLAYGGATSGASPTWVSGKAFQSTPANSAERKHLSATVSSEVSSGLTVESA
jgi:hypothetical protein